YGSGTGQTRFRKPPATAPAYSPAGRNVVLPCCNYILLLRAAVYAACPGNASSPFRKTASVCTSLLSVSPYLLHILLPVFPVRGVCCRVSAAANARPP